MTCSPSFRIVAILFMLMLGACVTSGGNKIAVDESAALAKLNAQDFRGGADVYLLLAKQNRAQRDHFRVLAADAYREADDWGTVDAVLKEIKLKNLVGMDLERLDLLNAERALLRNDFATALSLLQKNINNDLRLRQLQLTAETQLARNDGLASARARLLIDELMRSVDSRRTNRKALADALAITPIANLQQELGKIAPDDGLRPFIERALRKRGQIPARVVMRPIRVAGTQLPSNTGGWIREGKQAITSLAVLLPMSGNFESVGRAVLDGILAAYYLDQENPPSIKIYDVGSTLEQARQARTQAQKDGASQIIGPLSREQVDALLDDADETLPMLALNQSDDGSVPPKHSQTFGLLPEDEAAFIADEMIQRKFKRIILFTSNDEWAQRIAAAFKSQFDMLGGKIIAQHTVMTGASDINDAISKSSSLTQIDAVILAMRPEAARILVPQWRVSSAPNIPLFASSHVYSGNVARQQDRDMDGLKFVDVPWVHGTAGIVPTRDALASKLTSARASPRLFAFGLDAYRLAFYADWLSQHGDYYLQGATGQLAVDPFGRIHRIPAWLVFQDGMAVNGDGALNSDGGTNPQ